MNRFYFILASILISLTALSLSLAAPSVFSAPKDNVPGHRIGNVSPANIMKNGAMMFKYETSAAAIQSDDFDTCSLQPFWTHVQGRPGDPSPVLSDTAVLLDVPAGEDHDTFRLQSHANRIAQPAPDEDFEIEAKFDSGVGTTWQTQGLLVEQDFNDLLRFEFYGKVITIPTTVTKTHAYTAKIVDGDPTHIGGNGTPIAPGFVTPLYMRVKREGDQWTHTYSFDGTDWTVYQTFTHSLEVSSVSVYGGNSSKDQSSAPAHTSVVDYFYNLASPGSGDSPPTLTINEVGNGAVAKQPDSSDYECGQIVALEATADPGWAFTGWSGDLSGFVNPSTITMDGDRTVTATFEPVFSHTLTLTAIGAGSIPVEPVKEIYSTGDIITVTALAEPGWVFTGWSGDLSGDINPSVILIREDKTIIANFEVRAYLPIIAAK